MKVSVRTKGVKNFITSLGKASKAMRDDLAEYTWRFVVEDTPVDSGTARASWQVRTSPYGTPLPYGQYAYPSYPGAPAGRKSLFIVNETPWITALNYGHSQQAPALFIETAAERARNAVRTKVYK